MSKLIKLMFISLVTLTPCLEAGINSWWGQISFRQRHETVKDYTDISFAGEPGTLRFTTDNTKTRLGYQLGLKIDVAENIYAGLTLRSGLGSVMWQDIDSQSGLAPGVQEAYIDWKTPYLNLQLGRVPQEGTAMWDLYAGHKQTDPFRQEDPRDGVFNDRMSALNGVKSLVPLGPLDLRGVFHTDYVAGFDREFSNADQDPLRNPDKQVITAGFSADLMRALTKLTDSEKPAWDPALNLDFDYGFPTRAASPYIQSSDSVFSEEKLWGGALTAGCRWGELQLGYGYNGRDSIYTSRFTDVKAIGELYGFTVTARYQHGVQEHEFGIYKGHETVRDAWHVYFNREVWNLDIQPRVIWFLTEVDGNRQKTLVRMEITTTVRFY